MEGKHHCFKRTITMPDVQLLPANGLYYAVHCEEMQPFALHYV